MDRILMTKQIAAAVLGQDQLVFVYCSKKDGVDHEELRYATPIELTEEDVLCAQHLPKEGYRRFKLESIKEFHRVISRDAFANSSFFHKADATACSAT